MWRDRFTEGTRGVLGSFSAAEKEKNLLPPLVTPFERVKPDTRPGAQDPLDTPPFFLISSCFAIIASYTADRSTATLVLNQRVDHAASQTNSTGTQDDQLTSTSSSSRTPPRLPPGSILSNSSHALETPSSPILCSAVRTLSSASSSASPSPPFGCLFPAPCSPIAPLYCCCCRFQFHPFPAAPSPPPSRAASAAALGCRCWRRPDGGPSAVGVPPRKRAPPDAARPSGPGVAQERKVGYDTSRPSPKTPARNAACGSAMRHRRQ